MQFAKNSGWIKWNKTIQKKNVWFLAMIPLSFILMLCVIYRADTLSFTHDESGTYFLFKDLNVFYSLFNGSLWVSANNHILNTTLYRASIRLFGQSDFSLRLPNVLSFAVLIYMAMKLSKSQFKSGPYAFLFFIWILLNPYTIDFFSLCRGYGLSMCLHVGALYLFAKYIQHPKWYTLLGAYISIAGATLSVMTHFMLIPSYTLGLWLVMGKKYKKIPPHLLLIPLATGIFLSVLLYIPIRTLSALNEFKFGTGSIWDSFRRFHLDTLNGMQYLGRYTHFILTVVLLMGLAYGVGLGIKIYLSKTRLLQDSYLSFIALSFFVLFLIQTLSYLFFDIRFPFERKTTLYFPLVVLFLTLLLEKIFSNNVILPGVMIVGIGLHFILSFRMHETREWAYDAMTETFIERIAQRARGKEVRLATHWYYHPTSTYYILTKQLNNIRLAPYSKSLQTKEVYDFFIAPVTDTAFLTDHYTYEKGTEYSALFIKKARKD